MACERAERLCPSPGVVPMIAIGGREAAVTTAVTARSAAAGNATSGWKEPSSGWYVHHGAILWRAFNSTWRSRGATRGPPHRADG